MNPEGITFHAWLLFDCFFLPCFETMYESGLISVRFAKLSTTVCDVHETSYFYGLISTFYTHAIVMTPGGCMKCNLLKTNSQKLN